MVAKHLVHHSTVHKANTNWNKLKCTPIGPFLQMIGIVPGNANDTANKCKSSAFSSQFNSSMTEHVNSTNQLASGMGTMTHTIQNIRGVLYNIRQQALNDLRMIFKQIFNIYIKIGNIFYVMIKHLVSIMEIFKAVVGVGTAISSLLIDFINLIREPINGINDMVQFFARGDVSKH
jgi:methyl-accepting chemotaxis protein